MNRAKERKWRKLNMTRVCVCVCVCVCVIEAFASLEKAARSMNLLINQEKTKYMPVTEKSHASYPHYLEVGPYKFQVVHSFTYLGSDVNCNNDRRQM